MVVAVQRLDVVAALDDARAAVVVVVGVMDVSFCEMSVVRHKWFVVALVVVVVAADDDDDACNLVAADAYSNYSYYNYSFAAARHLCYNVHYSYSY